MTDMILMPRNEVREAADALFNLTDWLEEHDRSEDDIARIESLGASFLNIERINNTVYIAVYHDTDRGSAPVCMIEVELNTQNPDADNEFSVAVTEAASAFTHQHYIAADESQRR